MKKLIDPRTKKCDFYCDMCGLKMSSKECNRISKKKKKSELILHLCDNCVIKVIKSVRKYREKRI